MDWRSTGAELPPKWKSAISAHHQNLLGRKGLGRYAWCVAAEVLLCLPPERLRALAAKLREEAEGNPEAFAEKWDNREQAARAVAAELRAALNDALKSVERAARSKQKRR